MIELILFAAFGLIGLVSALLVITKRSPITAVLFLILAFFGQAGLYFLLGAQFIGAMQIIVYTGAIMVLFVFVLMLLDLRGPQVWEKLGPMRTWLGFAVAAVIFLTAVTALTGVVGMKTPLKPELGEPANIGQVLFTQYLLPFEIASALLLAAIIGVVALLTRKPTSLSESKEASVASVPEGGK